MWERFSYYGMLSLLVLYLVSVLGFPDEKAYGVYALYLALGYAGPVIGGIIADRLLGFRNVIKIGAAIITMGHMSMMFIEPDKPYFLYISLAMIAVGTGFFKGNVTNLLGLCYAPDDTRRDKVFSLFYVSINLGAFISSLCCGFVAKEYGWHYGFSLAGVGMLAGLLTFSKFEYLLGDVGAMTKSQKALNEKYNTYMLVIVGTIVSLALCAFMLYYSELFSKITGIVGVCIFAYLFKLMKGLDAKECRNIIFLMVMALFMMLFFSLAMQFGTLFNLFTDRNVDTVMFGYEVPAASLQSINPLSIILFGPILTPLFTRLGCQLSILRVGISIASMIASLLTLYVGCLNADASGLVPVSYLIVSMSIMGAGELFIAPLVYDLYTKLSPQHLRGFMMGLLLLSLAFSNLAGNIIALFVSVSGDESGLVDPLVSLAIYQEGFLDFTYCNIVILIVFALLYPKLNRQYMSNFGKSKTE